MGGNLCSSRHTLMQDSLHANQTISTTDSPQDYSLRYQRPSSELPLVNEYTYQTFVEKTNYNFSNPKDLICAYFGVLREASHMEGYEGGCGSIGDGLLPYPIAYNMLSSNTQVNISQKQFTTSFRGTGHISLLKLYPLPESDIFFIEIEVITGPESTTNPQKSQLSYFAYYYGFVSVVQEGSVWRIDKIDYYPEEFLCAPYHSWFYDSTAVIEIVYGDNLGLVDRITDTIWDDGILQIYADGKNGQRYRFDFVRLTNGHDILIGEYIKKDDNQWISVPPELFDQKTISSK